MPSKGDEKRLPVVNEIIFTLPPRLFSINNNTNILKCIDCHVLKLGKQAEQNICVYFAEKLPYDNLNVSNVLTKGLNEFY
jgi:hypothetical protein